MCQVTWAVLYCVKQRRFGAVLSLDSLNEEDYMVLLKQSLEPKDRLTILDECEHPWPCFGSLPSSFMIVARLSDLRTGHAGSGGSSQVLPTDRLHLSAPSAKGTVELVYLDDTQIEHRLAGTTKVTPKDRAAYDSVREALKAGITFDVLEQTSSDPSWMDTRKNGTISADRRPSPCGSMPSQQSDSPATSALRMT